MRILLAEDDPYSLLILRAMLEKETGWQVVVAETGTQAWEHLQGSEVFDLCIFDIMMPGLSGLELAARMRADPRLEEQPVIFCTALNDRATVEQAAGLAASHYLTKPYVRDHIIRQVRRVAASRASRGRIEPPAKVAGRLGLDAATVHGMLARLQAELATVVTGLGAAPAAMQTTELGIRLNALKGAAVNLGARRLAEELNALEQACGPRGGGGQAELKRVATETEHLRRYLGAARSPDAKVA